MEENKDKVHENQSIVQKYTNAEGKFNFSRALLEIDNRLKMLEGAMIYMSTVITEFEDKEKKKAGLILPGDNGYLDLPKGSV